MIGIPVADRADKPRRPLKRKEQKRPVIVMREDIDERMQRTGGKEKLKPPAEPGPTRSNQTTHRKQDQQTGWGMK